MTESSLVYHYTSEDIFRSIIENRQIWASSPLYMNDAQEFAHGFSLVTEILDETKKQHGGPGAVLKKILPSINLKELLQDTYVVCASTESDLAHQWVDYAKKGGICLVIKPDQLFPDGIPDEAEPMRRFRMTADVQPAWYQVLYDRNAQRDKIKDLLDRYTQYVEGSNQIPADIGYPWRLYARASLSALICSFKHQGFRDEREIRFIAPRLTREARPHPKDKKRFYLPVQACDTSAPDGPATQLPIEEVILAPDVDNPPNCKAVEIEQFLRANDCQAPVRISNIPYRWL